MRRPRFKIRREFLQISNVSFLLVSSLKMDVLFLTTTSRKRALFILYFVFEEVCRSSSRLSLEKPSPSRLSLLTPLKMSKPRSKTRKEFLQISNVLSLLENNSRMDVPSPIITSKRKHSSSCAPSPWRYANLRQDLN